MSHAFNGKSANFFFNGDFDGEVTILTNRVGGHSVQIKVDSQDILDLVANHLRDELISEVEQMDTKDILKLLKNK